MHVHAVTIIYACVDVCMFMYLCPSVGIHACVPMCVDKTS